MVKYGVKLVCVLISLMVYSQPTYGHHVGRDGVNLSHLEAAFANISLANTISLTGLVIVCSVLAYKLFKFASKHFLNGVQD